MQGSEAESGDWAGGDAPAADPLFATEGLLAGTLVATPGGWVGVETLGAGDLVLVFDGAPRPILAMQSAQVMIGREGWPQPHWPLLVPDGALGNTGDLRLLPWQSLLLDSDLSETMFGDAFALVPALALEGWRGIAAAAPGPLETVWLPVLEQEALIHVAGGVLLFCPAEPQDAPVGIGPAPGDPAGDYLPLSLADARALVAGLIAQDLAGATSEEMAPVLDQAALRALSP